MIGTNNENPRGFFILESVPGSEKLPSLTIGHYYDQHYQSLARVPPSETFGEDETVFPLMEGGRKEEEKTTLAEEEKEKEGDDDEREEASKAGAFVENPFFVGSDDDGGDDVKTDGAVGESKEPVNEREEKDLASNQDEAAKGVEEENEPNAEDKSFSASPQSKYSALPSTECMECFRQWTHICAKEKKGNEDNSGRDGGLPLGLT